MTAFKRISVQQTADMINSGEVTLADIRDQISYLNGHIENAIHLHNNNIEQFLADTDKSTPLIIYCYHGNSSQQAAQYFTSEGFDEVYSMDGGFEVWRSIFPSA